MTPAGTPPSSLSMPKKESTSSIQPTRTSEGQLDCPQRHRLKEMTRRPHPSPVRAL
ncbi:hypothetical protein Q9189_006313, partial [Teloschistes chrysophthalmus]